MNDDAYRQDIERWHAERIARLTLPDGWLSLAGLEWLKPGANRIGSAADNDIVLAKAPAHLGSLEWPDGDAPVLTLAADAAGTVTIDGRALPRVTLRDDSAPAPTRVAFGSAHFVAIERSGRKGLRVRDSEAPARAHFLGIECFPVDPAWRIVADWEPLDPPFELVTSTVIGTLESHPAPGRAVFERDGQRCTL